MSTCPCALESTAALVMRSHRVSLIMMPPFTSRRTYLPLGVYSVGLNAMRADIPLISKCSILAEPFAPSGMRVCISGNPRIFTERPPGSWSNYNPRRAGINPHDVYLHRRGTLAATGPCAAVSLYVPVSLYSLDTGPQSVWKRTWPMRMPG